MAYAIALTRRTINTILRIMSAVFREPDRPRCDCAAPIYQPSESARALISLSSEKLTRALADHW